MKLHPVLATSIVLPTATALLSRAAAPSTADSRRPNLIFLLTNDQRDNTLGAMGRRPTGSGRNTQQPYPNLGMTWQQSSFQFVRQVRCKKAVFLEDPTSYPS